MLSIMININDLADRIKDFFIKNSSNPFLWIGIIIVALVIFSIVYQSLNKNE